MDHRELQTERLVDACAMTFKADVKHLAGSGILREILGCLDTEDRPEIGVPVNIEIGAAETPLPPGSSGRVTGNLEVGVALCLADRVVLAWSTGTFRTKTHSVQIPYATITEVREIQYRHKMNDLHALEVLAERRWPLLFVEQYDRWRLVLRPRLIGAATPVWDEDGSGITGYDLESAGGATPEE